MNTSPQKPSARSACQKCYPASKRYCHNECRCQCHTLSAGAVSSDRYPADQKKPSDLSACCGAEIQHNQTSSGSTGQWREQHELRCRECKKVCAPKPDPKPTNSGEEVDRPKNLGEYVVGIDPAIMDNDKNCFTLGYGKKHGILHIVSSDIISSALCEYIAALQAKNAELEAKVEKYEEVIDAFAWGTAYDKITGKPWTHWIEKAQQLLTPSPSHQ